MNSMGLRLSFVPLQQAHVGLTKSPDRSSHLAVPVVERFRRPLAIGFHLRRHSWQRYKVPARASSDAQCFIWRFPEIEVPPNHPSHQTILILKPIEPMVLGIAHFKKPSQFIGLHTRFEVKRIKLLQAAHLLAAQDVIHRAQILNTGGPQQCKCVETFFGTKV